MIPIQRLIKLFLLLSVDVGSGNVARESIFRDTQERMRSSGKVYYESKIQGVPPWPIPIHVAIGKSEPEIESISRDPALSPGPTLT